MDLFTMEELKRLGCQDAQPDNPNCRDQETGEFNCANCDHENPQPQHPAVVPRYLSEDEVIPEEVMDRDYPGKFLDDDSYNWLVAEDTDVLKPDGSLLLRFRKGVLTPEFCSAAYASLRDAATLTENRGIAAGGRFPWVKEDGTLSGTTRANKVYSGLAGYFDRYPRIPYCRTTAYTSRHMDRFREAFPFIKQVSDRFAEYVPSRYAAQKAMIDQTSKDFVIPGTVFTTVTVNKNWQTAVHKDAGDLAEGFGVLSVLEHGRFTGGLLVLPAYRIAVQLRQTDILFYDVHEWHGNTPFYGEQGFERIGCVFYYRKKMIECGTSEEELARAKSLGMLAPEAERELE